MNFLSKLPRLGLILIGIQVVLTILIPLWTKLYSFPCNVICLIPDNLSFFMLINLPGFLIFGFLLETPTLKFLLSSPKLHLISYTTTFAISSTIYYFIGWAIEKLWKKLHHR